MDADVRRTRKMDAPWNIATVGRALVLPPAISSDTTQWLRARVLYVS